MSKTFEKLITLTQVADGAPGPAADQYRVETNQEEVLKFYKGEDLNFSPEILEFWLEEKGEIVVSEIEAFYVISPKYSENYNLLEYSNLIQWKNKKIDDGTIDERIYEVLINDIVTMNERLNLVSENGLFEEVVGELTEEELKTGNYYIIDEDNPEYYTKFTLIEGESASEDNIYYRIIDESIYKYYSAITDSFKKEDTILKIELKINDSVVQKVFSCRFGGSEDMAKLSLYANGLTASIQSTKLEFNSNGLSVLNGGLQIIEKEEVSEYLKKSFQDGKGYETGKFYLLDENNQYIISNEPYNSELTYYELVTKEQENLIFGVDPSSNNLTLRGDIYAENGVFNGTINAEAGNISGMLSVETDMGVIHIGQETEEVTPYYELAKNYDTTQTYYEKDNEGNYIKVIEPNEENIKNYYIKISTKTYKGIYSSDYKVNESNGFYITDGKIYANEIYIGTSAQILDYLRLGTEKSYSYLQNPDKYDGIFLAVRKREIEENDKDYIISLSNTGLLNLGTLQLNGADSSIKSSSYRVGADGWYIGEDEAEFNDITVRGKIESSVMSYGEVQTVGGILMVRPSTIFKVQKDNENNYTYTLDNPIGFNIGDYCTIGESAEQEEGSIVYYQIDTIIDNKITFVSVEGVTLPDETFENKVITSYGQIVYDENNNVDTKNSTNIGIALNATDNAASCAPSAISIFEFNPVTKKRTNRIVLGKMAGEPEYGGLTGYGLYADNVYLKGSLISSTPIDSENPFYSGINTSSGVTMPKDYFPEKQIGEILFWAGATDVEDIEKSPFKVDSYGNLYAGSGYFEGSVITKATITAAKMRTAVLEGWDIINENKEAALTIRNVDYAINFKDSKEKTLMLITKDSFNLDLPAIFSQGISVNSLIDSKDGIKVAESKNVQIGNTILNGDNGLKIRASTDEENIFSIFTSQNIRLEKPTYHKHSIYSYNDEVEIRWAKVGDTVIGYDLYVKE